VCTGPIGEHSRLAPFEKKRGGRLAPGCGVPCAPVCLIKIATIKTTLDTVVYRAFVFSNPLEVEKDGTTQELWMRW